MSTGTIGSESEILTDAIENINAHHFVRLQSPDQKIASDSRMIVRADASHPGRNEVLVTGKSKAELRKISRRIRTGRCGGPADGTSG